MGRVSRLRFLVMIAAAATVSACASAPPAPPQAASAPPAQRLQKLTWILQLEHERRLAVPEPPPPAPTPATKGRRQPAAPTPPSPPDLIKLAADTEARVRCRAAIAIGRVGLKEGIPTLTTLVGDADKDVRQAAAFGLGLIGDRSASAALVPLLSDPEALVRGRAAEALGQIGAQDAAPAVAQMTAASGRAASVASIDPDDERWPGEPEAEAFKLGLFALVRLGSYDSLASVALDDKGRPVSNWWPVAYALQRINDPRAAPALTLLAGVKGRYTPAFAARGLGASKDPSAAAVLLPMLDLTARPREVVASAIRAVEQLGVRQAAAALARIAADARVDLNLRIQAVTALGVLKPVDQLPYVQDLLTDNAPAMRAAAVRVAAAIDPDNFTLILSGLERDSHWIARAALAEALATLPSAIALDRLTAMLTDEDRRVVPAVLRALVRVKAPEVEKILLAHLKEADFTIREAAATLIGEMKPAGGVAALREAYIAGDPDTAYGARAAAIEAIAAYGGSEAVEAIRPALLDKDWAVRVKVVELLGKLEPSADHRLTIRPAPGVPPAPYDDADLLEPKYSPHVFIETAKGTIEFELAVLDAPQTSRNFMALVRKGFFNGLQVHRVVPNFVVQDGDPRGDGEGGPGYTIRDELNERPYLRGTVGMALSWRDTGGSQFFITHSPQPHLDARYTAFGHVVNGMDVVDRIEVGDVIQRIRVWDGKSWQ